MVFIPENNVQHSVINYLSVCSLCRDVLDVELVYPHPSWWWGLETSFITWLVSHVRRAAYRWTRVTTSGRETVLCTAGKNDIRIWIRIQISILEFWNALSSRPHYELICCTADYNSAGGSVDDIGSPGVSPGPAYFSAAEQSPIPGGGVQKGRPRKRKLSDATGSELPVTMRLAAGALGERTKLRGYQ